MDIEIIPTTELLCHTTIFSQLILGASRTTSRLFIDSLIVYNSSIHCFENTKTTNFIFFVNMIYQIGEQLIMKEQPFLYYKKHSIQFSSLTIRLRIILGIYFWHSTYCSQ